MPIPRMNLLKSIPRKTTIDGKTAYIASVVVNGKEQRARIAEDGKLLGHGTAEKDDDD